MKICAHDGPEYPCDRPAFAKGYCEAHYKRQYKGKPMDTPIMSQINKGKICAHNGPEYPCERPAFAKGYCQAHYQRKYRDMPMDTPLGESKSIKAGPYNRLNVPWWLKGSGLETLEFID